MIFKNQILKDIHPKIRVLSMGFLSGLLAVAPAQGAKFLQVIERDSPRSLFVQAQGAPLREVLKEISKKSGIRFKIPEGLMNESLTLDIEERNWAGVVHRVLGDFNSVYIWKSPTRLDHVFVLDNKEGSEVSPLPINTPRKLKKNLPIAPRLIKKRYYRPGDQKRIPLNGLKADLSEIQLKKVARGPLSSPLSEKLFEDRKIKKFLQQNGVKTIEDGRKPILAVKVRKQAYKLLKAIKHAAMKKNS